MIECACEKGMTNVPIYLAEGLGVFENGFVTKTVKKEIFEDLDVNDDCLFYTEYCVTEWNKRKK